jgi:hypothetical protein
VTVASPNRTTGRHPVGRPVKYAVPVAFMLAGLVILPVDTSCTPPPKCATGQSAQRLPSYQGQMWTCAPGGPAS